MRIGIYPYAASEGAATLRDAINDKFSESNPARILLRNGTSRFRGRSDDFIINWGSRSGDLSTVTGSGTLVNSGSAVTKASDKSATAIAIGDLMVESTTSPVEAEYWISQGYGVFARKELNGHSGSGIVFIAKEKPEHLGNVEFSEELVEAPIYTKAILDGDRKEFRLHVFKGTVIAIQQKRRRNGWRENEDYSDIVRNHGNGWVFATSGITPSQHLLRTCVDAVAKLGLDFGAVDVVETSDVVKVYEVNTAPGLDSDTTRDAYSKAFIQLVNDDPITAPDLSYELRETPEAVVAPTPASQVELFPRDQVETAMRGLTPTGAGESVTTAATDIVPMDETIFRAIDFNKYIPEDLVHQVAKVIGYENARDHLFIAYVNRCEELVEVSYKRIDGIKESELIHAFSWDRSPQGHNFWSRINSGMQPDVVDPTLFFGGRHEYLARKSTLRLELNKICPSIMQMIMNTSSGQRNHSRDVFDVPISSQAFTRSVVYVELPNGTNAPWSSLNTYINSLVGRGGISVTAGRMGSPLLHTLSSVLGYLEAWKLIHMIPGFTGSDTSSDLNELLSKIEGEVDFSIYEKVKEALTKRNSQDWYCEADNTPVAEDGDYNVYYGTEVHNSLLAIHPGKSREISYELHRASLSTEIDENEPAAFSFNWSSTPQGNSFWVEMLRGVVSPTWGILPSNYPSEPEEVAVEHDLEVPQPAQPTPATEPTTAQASIGAQVEGERVIGALYSALFDGKATVIQYNGNGKFLIIGMDNEYPSEVFDTIGQPVVHNF
ncbi:hypothetical protein [Vibrio phage vB_VpaP_SJSY21]|nr:hypothetical protein [Vibrio phage vB_VpaP_SJSY21]